MKLFSKSFFLAQLVSAKNLALFPLRKFCSVANSIFKCLPRMKFYRDI